MTVSNSFFENAQRIIPAHHVVPVDGLAYVGWARMLIGAGMPQHSCVVFQDKPGIRIFDGIVVAIDVALPDGSAQRIWRPVLDEENVAVNAKQAKGGTLSLLQSAIARCRAKAVPMVTGYGICLHAGYGGDGAKFVADLGVTPDTPDLTAVAPLMASKGEGGPDYLHWAVALAAAKITDPNFRWEIQCFNHFPYMKAGSGFFVAVKTYWRGTSHTEILPIMDLWSYEPLEAPTPADWNRAVMRTLAKGIAIHTGYGISAYCEDEPALLGPEPPSPEDLELLGETLVAKGRAPIDLLKWLGVEGDDLSVLSKEQAERSLVAIGARKEKEPVPA